MYDKKKLKQMVVDAYNEDPEIVNNDATLLAYIWGRSGWNPNDTLLANLLRMPRSESVTRRRREAHEEGLIKYSKKALEDRTEAFINERDSHSSHSVRVSLDIKR